MAPPVLVPTSAGVLQIAAAYRLLCNIAYDPTQSAANQPTANYLDVFGITSLSPGTPSWDKIDATTYDNADPVTGIVSKRDKKVAQSREIAGVRQREIYADPDENRGWKKLRDSADANVPAQVMLLNVMDRTEQAQVAIVDVTWDPQGGAPGDKGVDNFTLSVQGVVSRVANPMGDNVIPNATSANPTSAAAASKIVVVIAGTGFSGVTGAAGVKFGAVNADHYWVDSDTQITAVTPVGTTGAANILVTGPAGADGTPVAFTRT